MDNLARARQIRAAGIPVYIAEDDGGSAVSPPVGLIVNQTAGPMDSLLFDFQGGTGVILALEITVNVNAFALARFDLELPWEEETVWLPDPLEFQGSGQYRFSTRNELEYPRDEVLNHRADIERLYRKGESLAGVLLGINYGSMPDTFGNGPTVGGFLNIYDQFLRPYRTPVSFWVDRSRPPEKRAAALSQRRRLFDSPDPVRPSRTAANRNIKEE